MLRAKDFRRMARYSLRGKWWMAIWVGFLAVLLGGSIAVYDSTYTMSSDSLINVAEEALSFLPESQLDSLVERIWYELESIPEFAIYLAAAVGIVIYGFTVLFSLAVFIIGGATVLGYARFNLHLVDGGEARTGDLFSQFRRLGEGFLMRLLMQIYTALWMLLLFIPGIVKYYSYAMTPYIQYENPGMPVNKAITRSRQLMKGNKWRLFCLELSFSGWIFLCILPGVIGIAALLLSFYFNPLILAANPFAFLWVFPIILPTLLGKYILTPYMEAARAAFYRGICRETPAAEPESTDVPASEPADV